MRCRNCGRENLLRANYCAECGAPFAQEQRDAAYSRTVYAKLDWLDDAWQTLKLDKITGNLFFRIAVLALIVLVGWSNIRDHGATDFSVLDGEDYEVQYNAAAQEFYILSQEDTVTVSLYVPGKAEDLQVDCLNIAGEVLESVQYEVGVDIALENRQRAHYRITALYEDESRTITVYTYRNE